MTAEEKLEEIRKEWDLYKEELIVKYPAKDGDDWQFTCPHHIKIEKLLNT